MGEYRNTRGEKPPETAGEKRRRVFRGLLAWLAAAAAVVAVMRFVEVPCRVPASGYATTSPYAEVRAPVAGVVASIEARSGDEVEAGAVLVRLADEVQRAALDRAETEEARARSELAFREAEHAERLRSHSNEVQVAALALDYARRRQEITRQLVDKGLASSRDLMADEHQATMAALRYRQLSEHDFGADLRQIDMLRRQLEAAAAAVRGARADLDARAVRAPAPGTLFRHTFFVGEVVRADQVLFEVFGHSERLLRLRVPERYATRVAVGMPVRAQFRPSKRLLRRVWTDATVSEMRGAIQAEGNETYRVVYCPYEPSDVDVPPGTTADAEILIGRVPLWRFIFGD